MCPSPCVPRAPVLQQRCHRPDSRRTGAGGPAGGSVPRVSLPVWVLSWALVDCIQELDAGEEMEKEVERLVKMPGVWLGCPAHCWLKWPRCQSQECSTTQAESRCKYEQPECLRWVSSC